MTVGSNNVIAIATLIDWLKRVAPVFQPMRRKTKPNRTMKAWYFSRASSELQVIARNCDWFMAMFFRVVIGRSNCFGFGFSTVIWKRLYNKAQYLIALFGIPGSSHVWLHTEWRCYWWNDKSWNRSSDWHFSKTAFSLSLSSELYKWKFTEVPPAFSEDKRVMNLFHVSTIALRLRA